MGVEGRGEDVSGGGGEACIIFDRKIMVFGFSWRR